MGPLVLLVLGVVHATRVERGFGVFAAHLTLTPARAQVVVSIVLHVYMFVLSWQIPRRQLGRRGCSVDFILWGVFLMHNAGPFDDPSC